MVYHQILLNDRPNDFLHLNGFRQMNEYHQPNDYHQLNGYHLSNDLRHLNDHFLNVGNCCRSLQLNFIPAFKIKLNQTINFGSTNYQIIQKTYWGCCSSRVASRWWWTKTTTRLNSWNICIYANGWQTACSWLSEWRLIEARS